MHHIKLLLLTRSCLPEVKERDKGAGLLIGSCLFSFVRDELVIPVLESRDIITLHNPFWEFIPTIDNS